MKIPLIFSIATAVTLTGCYDPAIPTDDSGNEREVIYYVAQPTDGTVTSNNGNSSPVVPTNNYPATNNYVPTPAPPANYPVNAPVPPVSNTNVAATLQIVAIEQSCAFGMFPGIVVRIHGAQPGVLHFVDVTSNAWPGIGWSNVCDGTSCPISATPSEWPPNTMLSVSVFDEYRTVGASTVAEIINPCG